MTDERHELITRDETGKPTALATLPPGSMANFLPKSVSELAKIAEFAAGAGMFGIRSQPVAFNIMLAGAHLGLTPYAALEGITLINGRPVVGSQVQWTLILTRGQVTKYEVEASDDHCAITVHSRKWREPKTETVQMDDVPAHLRSKQTYKQHPADMLFAFCVRRLRKRYFPEVMVGVIDHQDMDTVEGYVTSIERATEVDPNTVDVGMVIEHVPDAEDLPPCAREVDGAACMAPQLLQPGKSGGMFLVCAAGHFNSPPQAVRDAIRGHKDGTAAIQQEDPDDAHGPGDADADAGAAGDGPGAGHSGVDQSAVEPGGGEFGDDGSGAGAGAGAGEADAADPPAVPALDTSRREGEVYGPMAKRAAEMCVAALKKMDVEDRLAWLDAAGFPMYLDKEERPAIGDWLASRNSQTLLRWGAELDRLTELL